MFPGLWILILTQATQTSAARFSAEDRDFGFLSLWVSKLSHYVSHFQRCWPYAAPTDVIWRSGCPVPLKIKLQLLTLGTKISGHSFLKHLVQMKTSPLWLVRCYIILSLGKLSLISVEALPQWGGTARTGLIRGNSILPCFYAPPSPLRWEHPLMRPLWVLLQVGGKVTKPLLCPGDQSWR